MSEWIACERCGFRGWIPNDYHGCLRWPSGLGEAAFACAEVHAAGCCEYAMDFAGVDWHAQNVCTATDAIP